jgi:hypothetical protein
MLCHPQGENSMSRLTIDVTDQQHQSLKALAALQGKTIKEYAIAKLFSSDPDEQRALMELKTLLNQRIAEADAGKVDTRSITDIAESVLSASRPRE